jgi:RNA polymerase sigma-70 factor (ECF subfamily)
MLRFYEGYNTKEVSEKLNITVRTVETHVSKSLKYLRQILSPALLILLGFIFASLIRGIKL